MTERAQLERVWSGWIRWALTHQRERRALSHLGVSDDVTAESRRVASEPYGDIERLLDRSRNKGPMRDVPLMFIATLVLSFVDATIDYVRQEPNQADQSIAAGFEALWRAIS